MAALNLLRPTTIAISALILSTAVQAQDAGHSNDYRTFHADGKIEFGKIADSYSADLVLYLAGNQFMVMEDLIKDFQRKHAGIKKVYVETIPPGQILKQILEQSQIEGQNTAMNPDVYASVSLEHLQQLEAKGVMDQYMTYTHNKLELMVAAGNPKGIKGPQDLARGDLVQSHPNPITEGIFKFYGAEMLKDMGLYEKVTGNAQCKDCWAIPGKTWFTSRHHRETPDRIEKGEADVGIVWSTEIVEAKHQGRKVEGVAIPDPLNKSDQVGYAIGMLKTGRNPANAKIYLDYLASSGAQNIYASYGFVKAKAEGLLLKAIP